MQGNLFRVIYRHHLTLYSQTGAEVKQLFRGVTLVGKFSKELKLFQRGGLTPDFFLGSWDSHRRKIRAAAPRILGQAQTIASALRRAGQPAQTGHFHRPDRRRTDRRSKVRDPQVREELGTCQMAETSGRHSICPGWRLEGCREIAQGNGRRFEAAV